MPIGIPEWGFIVLIIILLFGAAKLPELARSLGKATGEFKKAQKESDRELREFEASLRDTPQVEKQSKIRKMALELSIPVEGKTDDQLLDEIREKAKK